MTPRDFAKKILTTMGYPTSDNNINALVAWQALEGGHYYNAAKFNPLNTTQKMPGSYNPGFKAGVQAYKDWQQGIDATIKTLKYPMYSKIRDALQKSLNPNLTLKYINDSPWGTKNFKGKVESLLGYADTQDVDQRKKINEPQKQVSKYDKLMAFLNQLKSFLGANDNMNNFLIVVNSTDYSNSLEFSRILSLGLQEELGATTNICSDGTNIELECSFEGPKDLSEKALKEFSNVLALEFKNNLKKYGNKINILVLSDKNSTLKKVSDTKLNTNRRIIMYKMAAKC